MCALLGLCAMWVAWGRFEFPDLNRHEEWHALVEFSTLEKCSQWKFQSDMTDRGKMVWHIECLPQGVKP